MRFSGLSCQCLSNSNPFGKRMRCSEASCVRSPRSIARWHTSHGGSPHFSQVRSFVLSASGLSAATARPKTRLPATAAERHASFLFMLYSSRDYQLGCYSSSFAPRRQPRITIEGTATQHGDTQRFAGGANTDGTVHTHAIPLAYRCMDAPASLCRPPALLKLAPTLLQIAYGFQERPTEVRDIDAIRICRRVGCSDCLQQTYM